MEAGDDPGEGRGDEDPGCQLPVAGAEDASVGDEIAVDLADALERVEKDDEEDKDRGGRDLRFDVETQGDGKESADYHARNGVGGLDVRTEAVGQQPATAERHPENATEDRSPPETADVPLHSPHPLIPNPPHPRPQ